MTASQLHISPNGLTTLAARQAALPLVTIQFWVQTGSTHEGAHLGSGLSHLVEHMVFKGSAHYSGRELSERVPALGGQWNAYTSTDRTVYYIDGPAEHWREFLHLLAELVLRPAFPTEDFENERETIRREMAMYRDDPQDAAYHALMGTLFKAHPRRLPVIGEESLFNALSHADMCAYHRERYVPGNMFISVAGDVQPAEFFAAVDEELADIPARAAAPCHIARENRQWGPRLLRREFAQPTSALMLAWRVPHASHADAAPLTLLASILSEGRSAWLFKRFHDEENLAHDISVSLIPDSEGEGAFVVEADVEREERDHLRDALLAYAEELGQRPAADFETSLARTIRQLRSQRLHALSTVQGFASAQGLAWHLTRNTTCMEEWHAALRLVTPDELVRVARLYLRPDRLVEVSVDPVGSNGPAADSESQAAVLGAPQEFTLANGLRLITRIDRRLPAACSTLALGAGCPSEPAEKAGLNSLLAECLLKGTATRSAAEVAEALESLGGSISGNVGNNTLTLSARVLAEDTGSMLELLADVLLHPSFPADAVEAEKNAIVADIRDAEEDPAALAFRRMRRLCYGAASYGHHPDGEVASVKALTRADLVAQHARLACGRNAVLAVVGDIDPQAVRAQVEELFATLPAGQAVVHEATPPQRAGSEHVASDKAQAVLALALPALTARDTDLPLQMLFEEWCRDMAGPLFTEIREKRGLAYYAAATSLAGVDTGFLCFYMGIAPDKAAEARRVLDDLLADIAREGMPAEALESARATALSARLLALQSSRKLSAFMAVDCLLGLGPDYSDTVPERLRRITLAEINAFITRLLAPDAARSCICVGGAALP